MISLLHSIAKNRTSHVPKSYKFGKYSKLHEVMIFMTLTRETYFALKPSPMTQIDFFLRSKDKKSLAFNKTI